MFGFILGNVLNQLKDTTAVQLSSLCFYLHVLAGLLYIVLCSHLHLLIVCLSLLLFDSFYLWLGHNNGGSPRNVCEWLMKLRHWSAAQVFKFPHRVLHFQNENQHKKCSRTTKAEKFLRRNGSRTGWKIKVRNAPEAINCCFWLSEVPCSEIKTLCYK